MVAVGPWRLDNLKPLNEWSQRIGQVQDIMHQPCTPTVEMAIMAAWTATPWMIWSLFKPDAFDATTERLGRGHKRRRRYRMTGIEAIRAELPVPPGKSWARFVRAGGYAERIGWYMLIIDAGTEGAVRWSSLAMQYAGCTEPKIPACKVLAGPQVIETSSEEFVPLTEFVEEEFKGIEGDEFGIELIPTAFYNGEFNVTLTAFDDSLFGEIESVALIDTVSRKIIREFPGATFSAGAQIVLAGSWTNETKTAPLNSIGIQLRGVTGHFRLHNGIFKSTNFDGAGNPAGRGTLSFGEQFVTAFRIPAILLDDWNPSEVLYIRADNEGFFFYGAWGMTAAAVIEIQQLPDHAEYVCHDLQIYDRDTDKLIATAIMYPGQGPGPSKAIVAMNGIGVQAKNQRLGVRLHNVSGGCIVTDGYFSVQITGDKGFFADP